MLFAVIGPLAVLFDLEARALDDVGATGGVARPCCFPFMLLQGEGLAADCCFSLAEDAFAVG